MAHILCGNCRQHHNSVADVRACHEYANEGRMPEREPRPAVLKPVNDRPDVPAGRYALRDDNGKTNNVRFYKVDCPTEGRWAGWTFLSVQASDDLFPIKDRATKAHILRRIAEDPQAAMLLYGKEIGKCGHCGRTLTNDESRERGIGPVCAGRMGWAS